MVSKFLRILWDFKREKEKGPSPLPFLRNSISELENSGYQTPFYTLCCKIRQFICRRLRYIFVCEMKRDHLLFEADH